jgi:hypothetical protein
VRRRVVVAVLIVIGELVHELVGTRVAKLAANEAFDIAVV